MNQIIDVEFEIVDSMENKSVEELAIEANQYYAQAEAVANVALMYMAQAGARLEVIKEKLPHGEFGNWCKNNLNFSHSKADKMMKLSQKMRDEKSIFSNSESITNIGITKVWALLSAPEDVAEQLVENPDAAEMSTREFKDEIKRLKEEKQRLEEEKAELESGLESEKKHSNDLSVSVRVLNNRLDVANEKIEQLKSEPIVDEEASLRNEELEAEIKRLNTLKDEAASERDKLNEKLAKEKEKAKALKKNMDEEIGKQVEAAKAEAKEEALIEARKESDELQAAYEESQRNIEKLERQLQQNSNESLIEFKIKCNLLQLDFNSALESIDGVDDPEQSNKMKMALGAVLDAMRNNI